MFHCFLGNLIKKLYICRPNYMKHMKNIQRYCLYVLLVSLLSCGRSRYIDALDNIKRVGDSNPDTALLMLDSLAAGVRGESEYVRNKYELLKIRLCDKAYRPATSDVGIRNLMGYFGDKGSSLERQEVYYYAGSVYRDLCDTPRALEYFLKSLDYAQSGMVYDTVMLRNTYSNLHYLYYNVQDYGNAALMARNELDVCRLLGSGRLIPYLHLCSSYIGIDSLLLASEATDSAFNIIRASSVHERNYDDLVYVLYYYSMINNKRMARECHAMIEKDSLLCSGFFPCLSFAYYYDCVDKKDSAIAYCEKALGLSESLEERYDATKLLFALNKSNGDDKKACRLAYSYMQLSDSLDFGKRQEMAAQINNQHKYYIDKNREQTLSEQKEKYRRTLYVGAFVAILLLCLGYVIHITRRNKQMKKILSLNAEIERVNSLDEDLRNQLLQKESELKEKMAQNKTLLRLLHKSELTGKAEKIIESIRQSSNGAKTMSQSDWDQLFSAVDALYPDFKEQMVNKCDALTEQQIQFCYLLRIGLSNVQIKNVTNMSRVTVWRWMKKFEWIEELG